MRTETIKTVPLDGYQGIWYYNQPSEDEYKFKYSGGLGTYCAKHIPLSFYSKEVNKTYFCYGGTSPDKNNLLHMVSYYDHETGTVPRPRMLLDKKTSDAHDNPTIMLDDQGHIWIFSSSHGTSRPSFIHVSTEPHSIESFTRVFEGNFSYPQCWFLHDEGFLFLHTKYFMGRRMLVSLRSHDGREWDVDETRWLATIEMGHYQLSGRHGNKVGTAFNYHPEGNEGKGLNYRTNLYYMETTDGGETWHAASGNQLELPLEQVGNAALVHDFKSDARLVYLKDLNFDKNGNPIIMFLSSGNYRSGPQDTPRAWKTARWTGFSWEILPRENDETGNIIVSDSNYDTGCLHVDGDGRWRTIGPSGTGPQPYNPGGEMEVWISGNQGQSWNKERTVTKKSKYNHTYARRPVNAHPDFMAFWADGNPRKRSQSRLYFCNADGSKASQLPFKMKGQVEKPVMM